MDPTFKGLSTPTPNKVSNRKPFPKWLLYFGAFALLALVAVIIAMMLRPKPSHLDQRLLYRIDNLVKLANTSKKSIRDGNLAKINTDLVLILNGDNSNLKKAFTALKMDDTLSAIKADEADARSTDQLKTAQINGKFDATYKPILTQKVEASLALVQEIYEKKGLTNAQKTALSDLYQHLNNYLAQLKALP